MKKENWKYKIGELGEEEILLDLLEIMNEIRLDTITSGIDGRYICFTTENDEYFLSKILPKIVEQKAPFIVSKVYNSKGKGIDDYFCKKDEFNNNYHWTLEWFWDTGEAIKVLINIFEKLKEKK